MQDLTDEQYTQLLAMSLDSPLITYKLLKKHGFLAKASLEELFYRLDTITFDEAKAVAQDKREIYAFYRRRKSSLEVNGRYTPASILSTTIQYCRVLKIRDESVLLKQAQADLNLPYWRLRRMVKLLGIRPLPGNRILRADIEKIIEYRQAEQHVDFSRQMMEIMSEFLAFAKKSDKGVELMSEFLAFAKKSDKGMELLSEFLAFTKDTDRERFTVKILSVS